jgi:hypothetical protein
MVDATGIAFDFDFIILAFAQLFSLLILHEACFDRSVDV